MHLNLLLRTAEKSKHHRYLHSALIYSGSRLLAIGYNNEKFHAEVMAINRLKALFRTNNSRMPHNLHLVSFMRKRVSGFVGNSFPCPRCLDSIKRVGIRRVTFFNGDSPCQMKVEKTIRIN